MKKLFVLIMILSLAGFVSCKKVQDLFGGSSKNKEALEKMMAANLELHKKIKEDSIMHIQELNMLREQYETEMEKLTRKPELQKGVKGYFVVVGSFKKPAYAENYATKIKAMGYEGAMVEGPNQFTLVTSATHTNLKSAIEGQRLAIEKISGGAWVYVKK